MLVKAVRCFWGMALVHECCSLMSRIRPLQLFASRWAGSLVGETSATGKPSSLWGCVRVAHSLIPVMWQSFCPFVSSLKTWESKCVKRCSLLFKIAAWHIFYPVFTPVFRFPSLSICIKGSFLKPPLQGRCLPPFFLRAVSEDFFVTAELKTNVYSIQWEYWKY